MNKRELVDKVVEATGLNKVDVDRALKAIVWNISDALSKEQNVIPLAWELIREIKEEKAAVV